MHLTKEQAARYRLATTALLEYANDRLKVVQRLPPHEEELLMSQRMSLIGRELWRNLGVVDGFVRDNPAELPHDLLDSVRDWSSGICGTCIIAGFEKNGNAVVEHVAGTFSVRGIMREPAEVATSVPMAFKTALLPFEGAIVFGSPIDPIGCVGEEVIRNARQKASDAGFSGTVRTAEELLKRSIAYAPLLVTSSLESLGSTFEPASVPAGYHRGPLAGLDVDERIAACDDRIFDVLDRIGSGCYEPLKMVEGAFSGDAPSDGAECEVIQLAHACTMLYGIISLADVYDQYVAISSNPLPRSRFYDVLVGHTKSMLPCYGVWSHQGVRYVVAASLTELGARLEIVNWLSDKLLVQDDGTSLPGVEVSASPDDQVRKIVDVLAQQEYLAAQEYCVDLLKCQGKLQRRRVERRMVERGMTRYLLELEAVRQLVAFIGERIPDGQDDYLFADDVTSQIIGMFLAGDARVGEAFSLLEAVGLAGCEGGTWSDTLGRMVVNVYNAVPRWSMDGWSYTQITERLTGRRTFFAADGTPMRVGSDDACPCGSGRRFKQCCGR